MLIDLHLKEVSHYSSLKNTVYEETAINIVLRLDRMRSEMEGTFELHSLPFRSCSPPQQTNVYFRIDPLPGRNALVPSQPGEKTVHYPARPVDTTTDFEGTTSVQPQQLSANAVSGSVAGASMVSARPVPRPMMVGMNRMGNPGMAFNMASQAGMGGVNPGGIPMQRGNAAQAHQQQVQQLRRKDQGMGMQPVYP